MKLYRSLEFSNLIWLASDYARKLWFESDMKHSLNNQDRSSNWWLNNTFENKRRYIIADICKSNSKTFFEKSIEYNAMHGGRFNPAKSFGTLYTSTHPLVSALEVIYHQFLDAYPLYNNLNKNKSKFTSSFNFHIPKKLDFVVVTFEIDFKSEYLIRDVAEDDDTLINYCNEIGFHRYIGDNFTRDFIFGNDYEISRLLGCYLQSKEEPFFKVPSARVDFMIQDELEVRNVVIPEKNIDYDKFSLTGNFYEYRISVDLDLDENQHFPVNMKIYGESDDLNEYMFHLQPRPNKRRNSNQVIKYMPNIEGEEKASYSREVEIQKFVRI